MLKKGSAALLRCCNKLFIQNHIGLIFPLFFLWQGHIGFNKVNPYCGSCSGCRRKSIYFIQ